MLAASELYRAIFASIPDGTPGKGAFGHWLDVAKPFHVQAGLTHIILGPYSGAFDTQTHTKLQALVRKVAPSPMSRADGKEVLALLALIAAHLSPSVQLVESSNAAMEAIYLHAQSNSSVQVMLKVCEHSWDAYIDDVNHWERLFWSIDSHLERVGPKRVHSHIPTPLAAYCIPGFNRAMLKIFKLEGESDTIELDEHGVVLETVWR